MSPRVVLYAEGALESGQAGFPLPLGDELRGEELGPAHVLVKRCLAAVRSVPEDAVRFQRPLRTSRGLVPRGSLLLDPATLRRLLSWPPGERRPDLAVVLIDADGDRHRASTVERGLGDLPLPRVIGLAVQEFEAWLIADEKAVSAALGVAFPTQKAPESMKPRAAKDLLLDWTGRAGANQVKARLTIAATADLDVIRSRCPAFQDFRARLA